MNRGERLAFVLVPVTDIRKVKNTSIVVVLAGEDDSIQVAGMRISNWMTICVPASKAEVEATHEAYSVVDDQELLVMRPVQDNVVSNAVDGLNGGV